MMDEADSAADLLRHPAIRGARKLVTGYSFRLQGMLSEIRIRLYTNGDGRWYEAEQNIFLQTPCMNEPAVPETQRYASVENAMKEVLASFTEGYEQAVADGHEPDDTWLLPAD